MTLVFVCAAVLVVVLLCAEIVRQEARIRDLERDLEAARDLLDAALRDEEDWIRLLPDPEDLWPDVPVVAPGGHTAALTYSLWERFVFRVTGRWPEAVVERRLSADDADRGDVAYDIEDAQEEQVRP